MFQSFDDPSDPKAGAPRLDQLRRELAKRDLSGFIVPHADEHQSEYLPPSAERLAWLTGFTRSAGMVVVLADRAAVFVDGRYTLQAGEQVDADSFEIVDLIGTPPAKWLAENLSAKDRVGYDPWLSTVSQVRRFSDACRKSGAALVAIDTPGSGARPVDLPAHGVRALLPPPLWSVVRKTGAAVFFLDCTWSAGRIRSELTPWPAPAEDDPKAEALWYEMLLTRARAAALQDPRNVAQPGWLIDLL